MSNLIDLPKYSVVKVNEDMETVVTISFHQSLEQAREYRSTVTYLKNLMIRLPCGQLDWSLPK